VANDNERVYRDLRRGIIEGTYAPGARLIEQRLAESFACSRTPVREAVRRLESEGLVVVEPNRGAHVRPLAEDEISDLYEVRARLEAYAAELAAIRGDTTDRVRLRQASLAFDEAVADMLAAREDPSLARVRALDDANGRFHGTVLAMSRHSRLQALVAGAVDAPLVFQALQRFTTDELNRSRLFHDSIAAAIDAGESVRAGRLMTEHILQGRDSLLQHLSDAGGLGVLFAEGA